MMWSRDSRRLRLVHRFVARGCGSTHGGVSSATFKRTAHIIIILPTCMYIIIGTPPPNQVGRRRALAPL